MPSAVPRSWLGLTDGSSHAFALLSRGSNTWRLLHFQLSGNRITPATAKAHEAQRVEKGAMLQHPHQRGSATTQTASQRPGLYLDFLKHNAIRLYHSTSYHSTVL